MWRRGVKRIERVEKQWGIDPVRWGGGDFKWGAAQLKWGLGGMGAIVLLETSPRPRCHTLGIMTMQNIIYHINKTIK